MLRGSGCGLGGAPKELCHGGSGLARVYLIFLGAEVSPTHLRPSSPSQGSLRPPLIGLPHFQRQRKGVSEGQGPPPASPSAIPWHGGAFSSPRRPFLLLLSSQPWFYLPPGAPSLHPVLHGGGKGGASS